MQVNSIFLTILLVLMGCETKELEPEQYIRWVDDKENGLIKEESIGKIKYTVSYRPSDYQKAKYLLDNDTFGLKHSETKNHAFIVKMEPIDGKTQILTINAREKEEPFQRINYYLSEAQNYISLLEGADTVNVSNYIYERFYNVSPAQNLVMGFQQNQNLGESDLSFIMEDKIFNTGKIIFNFSKTDLKNIPKLINYE